MDDTKKFDSDNLTQDDLAKIRFGARSKMKIPKKIPLVKGRKIENVVKTEIAKTIALAKGKKYVRKKYEVQQPEKVDEQLFVRYDASEMIIFTKMKKLIAYILTVTHKSPKFYRFSLVNRLHSYALDSLEHMYTANAMNKKLSRNKIPRLEHQREAYTKLQLLGYMSFLSYENGCILKKQYAQIAKMISDCVSLLVAWIKSEQK